MSSLLLIITLIIATLFSLVWVLDFGGSAIVKIVRKYDLEIYPGLKWSKAAPIDLIYFSPWMWFTRKFGLTITILLVALVTVELV